MTAALLDRASTRLPSTRQTRGQAGPKLRVLDQVASRRRARHRSALLILFMAVLIGFFAVAFVHAELVAGQHDLDAVRAEISQAEARHAELARSVEAASAPDRIVTRATELGMVPARQPVYLAAAAPVRSIEVSPSLTVLATPATTGTDIDGSSISQVAAPASDPGQLRGTIGQPGGLSGTAQVDGVAATPSVALGTPTEASSPAGATTATAADQAANQAASQTANQTGDQTAGQTASTPVPTTAPADPDPGPASSIAGTRAVSSPTAGAQASAEAPAPAAAPAAGASVDTTPAGGLASAAATTSG